MKSALSLFIVSMVLVSFSNSALADRVNNRQARQRARIHQGVESGELTHGEAKKLRAEERRVRRAERRAKSDGVVTPEEKARLEGMQDKVSHDIYQQKHDEQSRGQ